MKTTKHVWNPWNTQMGTKMKGGANQKYNTKQLEFLKWGLGNNINYKVTWS
jgi:hypothetical protein